MDLRKGQVCPACHGPVQKQNAVRRQAPPLPRNPSLRTPEAHLHTLPPWGAQHHAQPAHTLPLARQTLCGGHVPAAHHVSSIPAVARSPTRLHLPAPCLAEWCLQYQCCRIYNSQQRRSRPRYPPSTCCLCALHSGRRALKCNSAALSLEPERRRPFIRLSTQANVRTQHRHRIWEAARVPYVQACTSGLRGLPHS